MSHKSRINLLQADIVPVKRYLNLTTVVVIWLLTLLIMVGLSSIKLIESNKLSHQFATLQSLNQTQTRTMEELQNMLLERKEDPALVAELSKLRYVLKHKSLLKDNLTSKSGAESHGYASILTELAQYHHKDIQVLKASVSGDQITLSGVTNHAQAVPFWLTNFENASFLRGKTFAGFSVLEEDSITSFQVSTLLEEGESND